MSECVNIKLKGLVYIHILECVVALLRETARWVRARKAAPSWVSEERLGGNYGARIKLLRGIVLEVTRHVACTTWRDDLLFLYIDIWVYVGFPCIVRDTRVREASSKLRGFGRCASNRPGTERTYGSAATDTERDVVCTDGLPPRTEGRELRIANGSTERNRSLFYKSV